MGMECAAMQSVYGGWGTAPKQLDSAARTEGDTRWRACGAPLLAASSRPPRQPPSSDNGAEPGVALCPASERLTYHQGSVLTGDIPMSILRYGKFTPALLRHGISLGIMVSTGDGANRSNVDAPVLVIMAIDSEDYVHVYAIKFIHREAEDSAESFRSF
jgi:hypothetical protein